MTERMKRTKLLSLIYFAIIENSRQDFTWESGGGGVM